MLGAIILAGGHGRRMGGADKASLPAHGTRFIDRLLTQLPYGTPAVAVSPHHLGLPQVCESPLYGGPVAGIAAGAQALSRCSELALFAVDAPDSPQLLPQLHTALSSSTADAALTRAADGYLQPLCSLWHAPALRTQLESLPTTRNVSVRRLIRGANFIEVPGTGAERDYDTRAELRELPQLCFPAPRPPSRSRRAAELGHGTGLVSGKGKGPLPTLPSRSRGAAANAKTTTR